MQRFLPVLLVVTLSGAAALRAQSNPLATDARADYETVKRYFLQSAAMMPAGSYAFKPTPEVRSFGQLVAHVADDQYNLCAPVKGETRQPAYAELEHTLTTKAELVAALQQAFAYCDGAYALLTDAAAADKVRFGGRERPKLSMLNWNTWHTWEHYGNVVVYLRLKGLVPPSSAQVRLP
jgi:uncharacterized damage-inducible protein DinB